MININKQTNKFEFLIKFINQNVQEHHDHHDHTLTINE